MAYDEALLAAAARVFADSVLGWYRRRMDFGGIAGGRSGAVVVIQRSSSDLALNPHLHGSCAKCGSRLSLHALVHDPREIGRILRHLGEPSEPPRLSPARGPPFDEPRVLRRIRADQPEPPQRELFSSDA